MLKMICNIYSIFGNIILCLFMHSESPEQDSTENPSSNKTKDEPDFGLSGKLAAETNTFQVSIENVMY